MTKLIVAYLTTMLVFLAIDYVWLTRVAFTFYRTEIGSIMADPPRLGYAAAFYLAFGVGVVIFAVKPALDANNLLLALIYGAILGFMCYGTYDFTNLAVIKGYTVKAAFVDLAWGTALTAVSAFCGTFLTRWFTG